MLSTETAPVRASPYGMMTMSLPPGPLFVVEEPEPLLAPGPPMEPAAGLLVPLPPLFPGLPPGLPVPLLPVFPPGLLVPGLVPGLLPVIPELTLPSLVGPFC